MALTGAMKVSVETSTSSSAATPITSRAICKADVPLLVATAVRAPTLCATLCSNRLTYSPTDETQPVSRQSFTYFHSFPRISGTERGMWVISVLDLDIVFKLNMLQ